MFYQTITLTTDASGAATGKFAEVSGRVLGLIWTKPGSGGITNATFAVTTDKTGLTIWSESGVSASKTLFPRTQVHSTAGVALTLDGTRIMVEPVPVCNESVNVAVSGGGNTLTGTLTLIVG